MELIDYSTSADISRFGYPRHTKVVIAVSLASATVENNVKFVLIGTSCSKNYKPVETVAILIFITLTMRRFREALNEHKKILASKPNTTKLIMLGKQGVVIVSTDTLLSKLKDGETLIEALLFYKDVNKRLIYINSCHSLGCTSSFKSNFSADVLKRSLQLEDRGSPKVNGHLRRLETCCWWDCLLCAFLQCSSRSSIIRA